MMLVLVTKGPLEGEVFDLIGFDIAHFNYISRVSPTALLFASKVDPSFKVIDDIPRTTVAVANMEPLLR